MRVLLKNIGVSREPTTVEFPAAGHEAIDADQFLGRIRVAAAQIENITEASMSTVEPAWRDHRRSVHSREMRADDRHCAAPQSRAGRRRPPLETGVMVGARTSDEMLLGSGKGTR